MSSKVFITRIKTGVILLPRLKRDKIKDFIKDVKETEKALKYPCRTRVKMTLNHCMENVEFHSVEDMKLTEKNFKVTVQTVHRNDEEKSVTLSFPIEFISSIEAEVF